MTRNMPQYDLGLNALGSFATGSSIANEIIQNRLRQQQLDQNYDIQNRELILQEQAAIRERQQQQAKQQLIQEVYRSKNPDEILSKVYSVDPQAASQISDDLQRRFRSQYDSINLLTNMDAKNKQAVYNLVRDDLKKQFPEIEFGDIYSNNLQKSLKNKALVIRTKLDKTLQFRDTAQGVVGFDPRTGESVQTGYATAPRASTVVNLGAAETEEQKGVGKIRAERFQKYLEVGDQAQKSFDTLETLKRAVSNPDVAQGSFATIRQEAKKVADLFGVEVEGLADEAILTAVGNKLALQLRNPKGEEGGLTGATSDRDLNFLVSGVPNRNKTREQNLALIEIAQRDKQRSLQLSNEAARYFEENNTMAGFEQFRRQWLEQNPLFEEGSADKERIKSMLESSPLQSKAPEQPFTEKDFAGFKLINVRER